MEIFTSAFCVIVSLDLTMVLYHYFKPADNIIPSPTVHLSSSISPATIKTASEAVRESALIPTSKSRGAYAKFTPAQQAKIGKYASMHGDLEAVRGNMMRTG